MARLKRRSYLPSQMSLDFASDVEDLFRGPSLSSMEVRDEMLYQLTGQGVRVAWRPTEPLPPVRVSRVVLSWRADTTGPSHSPPVACAATSRAVIAASSWNLRVSPSITACITARQSPAGDPARAKQPGHCGDLEDFEPATLRHRLWHPVTWPAAPAPRS
jgi:hypothetical protein